MNIAAQIRCETHRERRLCRGTLLAIDPCIGGAIIATPFLQRCRCSAAAVMLESHWNQAQKAS